MCAYIYVRAVYDTYINIDMKVYMVLQRKNKEMAGPGICYIHAHLYFFGYIYTHIFLDMSIHVYVYDILPEPVISIHLPSSLHDLCCTTEIHPELFFWHNHAYNVRIHI